MIDASFEKIENIRKHCMQIHKLDKLQAPYLSNLGDTTSPLSRKLTKSASETALAFLKIPIAPFMSAFRILPVEDLNNPLFTLCPR